MDVANQEPAKEMPLFNLQQVLNHGNAPILNFDQDALELKADLGAERVSRYETYRDWYDGEHNVTLSDRQKTLLEESGIPWSDNFVDLIVDSVVRRLSLTGFRFTPANDTATDIVSEIMRQNRMDLGTQRVHHNAVKLGDAFLICDFDARRNMVTLTYNKPDYMKPVYDDDTGEKMLYAIKRWDTTEMSAFNTEPETAISRMNIYYPDRIEKYYRPSGDSGDWLPFMDIDDLYWPVPWINEGTKEPLGIPVFHFRNKTLDGDFGVSEIKKAIPQQALLNKFVSDLDLIMDTQGYPQRWAKGVSLEVTDSDGNTTTSTLPTEPGETWTTDNENAAFGQFDPADVTGALAAIDMVIRHMSASNATTIDDLLSASKTASGESLKMKDSGLSDKAAEKELSFGNVWEDAIRYAIMLRDIFGQGLTSVQLTIADVIDSVWKDTRPRGEKTTVEVLEILVEKLGASQEWALREYGIENVEEVMAQRKMELEHAQEMSLSALTRGIDTTGAVV